MSHDTTGQAFLTSLGTPRAALDLQRDAIVWRWELSGEAFGASAPNEAPDGDGQRLRLDLRFPGQRHDPATGLYENHHRDYDPSTGRYLQSDPIGIEGGINTYGYAEQNPLTYIDPMGLDVIRIPPLDPNDPVPDGTIYCDGGTIKPFINFDAMSPDTQECIGDCALIHENSHINDALRENPGVCRYFGWVPFVYPKGLVSFSGHLQEYLYSERYRSELNAYAAELRCLSKKLKENKCESEKCDLLIKKRISFIIDRILPSIYSNRYPNSI